MLSSWGWQMSLWAALLGRLQVSGPSGGLVLSVSWGFWSIGLVLLVAPTTFHPPQAGSQVIPWSLLPSVHLKSAPLLKCTSNLTHFWTHNNNFFRPSIRFYQKKKLQLAWSRLLPEIQLKAHFRLTHCLLLALPVVNFSKTEDSEHEHCYLSHSLQTFQNRGIHIYMYFNHSL